MGKELDSKKYLARTTLCPECGKDIHIDYFNDHMYIYHDKDVPASTRAKATKESLINYSNIVRAIARKD